MVAAAGLISIKDFRAIRSIRVTEFLWALIAFAGVVLLGTLEGILIAVFLSLLTIMFQASFPPLYPLGRKTGTDVFRPLSSEHASDETFPGLLILRTEGRMNFASAPNLTDKLWQFVNEDNPDVLLIDLSAVPDLEYTALNLLADFEEELSEQGVVLWLAALNPVPLTIIQQSSLGERMGSERLFFNLHQAVETYLAQKQGE